MYWSYFFLVFQSPIEPLFPQLLNHTSLRHKSAKSAGSFVLDDGQLSLPKTFVTRKGAILLFTPSDDLHCHGNVESHLKKESVYEAGLKLRTLGNLTHSVLEFGKEVSFQKTWLKLKWNYLSFWWFVNYWSVFVSAFVLFCSLFWQMLELDRYRCYWNTLIDFHHFCFNKTKILYLYLLEAFFPQLLS